MSLFCSIKSNLPCSIKYSLFTSINSEDYIRLFIGDTLIHDYDDYAINWNSPWLNYCDGFFITINNKNDNCLIPDGKTLSEQRTVISLQCWVKNSSSALLQTNLLRFTSGRRGTTRSCWEHQLLWQTTSPTGLVPCCVFVIWPFCVYLFAKAASCCKHYNWWWVV